jgi:formylglycine-generating enzyme required for sulfatase activity
MAKSQRVGTATALMSSKAYTAVIGSFQPNGFGHHDKAGNVSKWCWDFYVPTNGTTALVQNNLHGPDTGKT